MTDKSERPWEPGFYTDATNGDVWILRIVDGQEKWRWVNGNRWSFVPRDSLVKSPSQFGFIQ